jgi:hypothetical protein
MKTQMSRVVSNNDDDLNLAPELQRKNVISTQIFKCRFVQTNKILDEENAKKRRNMHYRTRVAIYFTNTAYLLCQQKICKN